MASPNVNIANKYARDVAAGKITACRWIILACKKHLSELEESKRKSYPFIFDRAAAEKACTFIQSMPHTKGKWARDKQTLTLSPWQKFFVCSIFGWLRRDTKTRRFRRALLWVPRKNGKSALASAIGLYMFSADREYGAEVYSGATTEKQAWEVFRPAKIMAEKTDEFLEYFGVDVNASNINIAEDNSRFEPIIGNPGDGASPHCAIVDEYHEHKDDSMVETMESGMGARDQPLLLMITTAGSDISGPCYQMQIEAQRILEGVTENDETFSLIYTVDEDDDWTDPVNLIKANPNCGISVSKDFLLARLRDAKNNARKQSVFKTKHLNVWVGSKSAYFNVQKWISAGDSNLKIEDFKGCRVYIGLDLSSRVDIASAVILVEDPPGYDEKYVMFSMNYLPEAALTDENEHYVQWDKEGYLRITGGEMIDYEEIEADLVDLISIFEIQELAYDPFQATYLVTRLMDQAMPVVEMKATVQNFSEPMKELDGLIKTKDIRHDANPVFNWMISNVTGKLDKKDNVYPNKERHENKIDGPVALMMALARSINGGGGGVSSAIDNFMKVTRK